MYWTNLSLWGCVEQVLTDLPCPGSSSRHLTLAAPSVCIWVDSFFLAPDLGYVKQKETSGTHRMPFMGVQKFFTILFSSLPDFFLFVCLT